MTLKTNTAEGGSNGTAVTTANSGGASGDALSTVANGAAWAITFSNEASAHGGLSYKFATTDSAAAETALFSFNPAAASASAAVRAYLRVTGTPISAQFLSFRGTGVLARWQFNASGFIQLVNAAGGILWTATTLLTLDAWYRVELRVVPGTTTTDGTITGAVYEGDSTTAWGTFSASNVNAGTTQPSVVQVGRIGTGGTTPTFYLDDVAVQDSATGLIGPVVTNAAPVASAGSDQTAVEPWSTVTLTGTDSDTDGTIASRAWTKGGVTLATTATYTFEAPATIAGTTLTFTYTATDDGGLGSTDTVTVTVLPVTERAAIGGVEVPMRIRAS